MTGSSLIEVSELSILFEGFLRRDHLGTPVFQRMILRLLLTKARFHLAVPILFRLLWPHSYRFYPFHFSVQLNQASHTLLKEKKV